MTRIGSIKIRLIRASHAGFHFSGVSCIPAETVAKLTLNAA
jgi:hypothetical protein